MLINDANKKLISKWYSRLRRAQNGHYQAYSFYKILNLVIGVPAVAISAFVSTSIFYNITSNKETISIIFVGFLSVSATILSALQTFFKFPEKCESHYKSAISYGSLKRKLEQKSISAIYAEEQFDSFLNSIREEWDDINARSLGIPAVILKMIDWHIIDENNAQQVMPNKRVPLGSKSQASP